jgi:hypothetical protein
VIVAPGPRQSRDRLQQLLGDGPSWIDATDNMGGCSDCCMNEYARSLGRLLRT